MAAISAGEFERIFKELYKPLCLFALRFTEKTEDAEDVVQQAFADVWDKNSHNVVIANFKSYLYQAVRNRSLTLIAQSSDTLQTTECLADIEDLSEEEQIYQSEPGCAPLGGYRRTACRTEEDISAFQAGRTEISGDCRRVAYFH